MLVERFEIDEHTLASARSAAKLGLSQEQLELLDDIAIDNHQVAREVVSRSRSR